MGVPIFETYRKFWSDLMVYNGIESDAKKLSMALLICSLGLGIAMSLAYTKSPIASGALFLLGMAMVQGGAFTYYSLGANSRASKVEEVLPDFLELMASNIRSGLTPDKSLLVAARPEFGPLADAVTKAGTNSITGMPLDQVMLGIGETIRSDVLSKTTVLIVEGLHSGGDMAELLSKTALDLRKFRSVRGEVNSIIMSYVLFIAAAITFGAPLLYGVSSYLVDIMVLIRSKVGTGSETVSSMTKTMSMFKGKLMFTQEGVMLFSAAAILVTIFFGCIAIGSMTKGRRVEGLKYFPLLGILALGIFFGVRMGLQAFLGSMFKL